MGKNLYFYSIKQRVQAAVKIKRSVFTCTVAPVTTIGAAKAFISKISKENKTATHNCWAYILGESADLFHCSDAGEPSGTAGKPMLNALQHHRATRVAAVVTRVYGGVKLGVRGLMDAYFQSVDHALGSVDWVRQVSTVLFRIDVAYGSNASLLNRLKRFSVTINQTDYSETVRHIVAVERKDRDPVRRLLLAYQSRGEASLQLLPDAEGNPGTPLG